MLGLIYWVVRANNTIQDAVILGVAVLVDVKD
jgi:hypothetical protein